MGTSIIPSLLPVLDYKLHLQTTPGKLIRSTPRAGWGNIPEYSCKHFSLCSRIYSNCNFLLCALFEFSIRTRHFNKTVKLTAKVTCALSHHTEATATKAQLAGYVQCSSVLRGGWLLLCTALKPVSLPTKHCPSTLL